MKNVKIILLLALLSPLLGSCKQEVLSIDRRAAAHTSMIAIGMGLDTIQVDAFVRISAYKIYQPMSDSIFDCLQQAVFTGDTSGVDVSTVSVNGFGFSEQSTGQYVCYDSSAWGTTGIAQCIVTGYDSANVNHSLSEPLELIFSGVRPGDTVSASSGISLSYSGSMGGDLITEASFDPANTSSLGGDSSTAATGVGYKSVIHTDNGTATMSTGDLSSFTTNGYITFKITHWSYDVDSTSVGSKRVGLLASYSTTIPLYLKP